MGTSTLCKPMKPTRSRRNVISEKSVENYLVERVEALGGDAPKLDLPGARRGRTDRLVVFPLDRVRAPQMLRGMYVEVKAAGKSAEHCQTREHERLRALGFQVRLVWSYEDVDDLLRRYESH